MASFKLELDWNHPSYHGHYNQVKTQLFSSKSCPISLEHATNHLCKIRKKILKEYKKATIFQS